MCRSIKVLRKMDHPVTPEEVRAASLQFVRKISGFQKPSKTNQEAFERAVMEIADASSRLLDAVTVPARGNLTSLGEPVHQHPGKVGDH